MPAGPFQEAMRPAIIDVMDKMNPASGKSAKGDQRACNADSPMTQSSREQTASPPTPGSEGVHELVADKDALADDGPIDYEHGMGQVLAPIGSGFAFCLPNTTQCSAQSAKAPARSVGQLRSNSRSCLQRKAGKSLLGANTSIAPMPRGLTGPVQSPQVTELEEWLKSKLTLPTDPPQAAGPRHAAVFPPSTPTPTRRPSMAEEAIQNRSGAVDASAICPSVNCFPFSSTRPQSRFWGPLSSSDGLDMKQAPVAGGWPAGTSVSTHRRQCTDGSVPFFASHEGADSTSSHPRRHSDLTWPADRRSSQTALNQPEDLRRSATIVMPWNLSCPDTAGVSISESATRFLPMKAVLDSEARRAQEQQQRQLQRLSQLQQPQPQQQQQQQQQQPRPWHDDDLTRPTNVMLSWHDGALLSSSGSPLGASITITPPEAPQFSVNYHGMHTAKNASANHLSPEENCALWLTNLPPDVTTRELLAGIRNIGRVWCTYINGPDDRRHTTAAAKVVFFAPVGAQRLLHQSLTTGLTIRGLRVRVSHNRIKSAEVKPIGGASRVLIITGRTNLVNAQTLTRFFYDRFQFQVDEVMEIIKTPQRAVVEYRFGSYRCQAEMGKMALDKDRPIGLERVEFGQDPCETGVADASFQIAADRIRGIGL